jgi:murein DD-endopeptidase MepM/ murein hydrolase activator NlpD
MVITINMGKVSAKKTVIDNACDGAGLLLASGLSSVVTSIRQSLGIYGFGHENCDMDWFFIIGLAIGVLGVVTVVVTLGTGLPLYVAALGGVAALLGGGMVGSAAMQMAKEPGMVREMQAKFQNMTAEQRLFEGAIDYALFAVVDDPTSVPDRFDVDRDGLKYPGSLDKITRFSHWYFQRLNDLPRIGELIEEFFKKLFTNNPKYFEVVKDPSDDWKVKEVHFLSGGSWRVGDWIRDDFRPFLHELWCYGYGVNFARNSAVGCAAEPPPPCPGGFIWPVTGDVSANFGDWSCYWWPNTGCRHTGMDIVVNCGTPVKAAATGDVIVIGWDAGGYGNYIIIDHGDGISTLYAHLQTVLVGYERVIQGQVIALSGNTGWGSGCHLHFEVRVNGVRVDPRGYLTGSCPPTPAPPVPVPLPPAPPPTDPDELEQFYRELRDFEKFIKGFYGLSKDELIASYEAWINLFYDDSPEEPGSVDWYKCLGEWVTKINGWINNAQDGLVRRQDQIRACINSCSSRALACTSYCPTGSVCHRSCVQPDPDNPGGCLQWEDDQWRGCCGDLVRCCDSCNTQCPPTANCDTPCNPPDCTHQSRPCCSTACHFRIVQRCDLTRVQLYIDKLRQLVTTITKLQEDIKHLHDEADRMKSTPWMRQAIYAWKDKVLNKSGSAVSPVEVAHLVYVFIEPKPGFKFPSPATKRKWFGAQKCSYVKNHDGWFKITVGRYDEDLAKQGPLSNLWRFKFRRNAAGNEPMDLIRIRMIAERFATLLNQGDSVPLLDSLCTPGEFTQVKDFVYSNGIVSEIEVHFGPGFTEKPTDPHVAAKRNTEIYIKRKIK